MLGLWWQADANNYARQAHVSSPWAMAQGSVLVVSSIRILFLAAGDRTTLGASWRAGCSPEAGHRKLQRCTGGDTAPATPECLQTCRAWIPSSIEQKCVSLADSRAGTGMLGSSARCLRGGRTVVALLFVLRAGRPPERNSDLSSGRARLATRRTPSRSQAHARNPEDRTSRPCQFHQMTDDERCRGETANRVGRELAYPYA